MISRIRAKWAAVKREVDEFVEADAVLHALDCSGDETDEFNAANSRLCDAFERLTWWSWLLVATRRYEWGSAS